MPDKDGFDRISEEDVEKLKSAIDCVVGISKAVYDTALMVGFPEDKAFAMALFEFSRLAGGQ